MKSTISLMAISILPMIMMSGCVVSTGTVSRPYYQPGYYNANTVYPGQYYTHGQNYYRSPYYYPSNYYYTTPAQPAVYYRTYNQTYYTSGGYRR